VGRADERLIGALRYFARQPHTRPREASRQAALVRWNVRPQNTKIARSRATHGRDCMLKSRIAAAIAATLLCAGGAMAQDTIQVGANLPMSGPNAELGEIFSRAASIAAKDLNAANMP